MSKIASVYANSLFEVSLEEKVDNQIREEITDICNAFERDSELVKVLDAPMITKEEKEKLLDTLFKDKVNKYLLNFLKIMTDRKAVMYIRESFDEYVEVYNRHYNIEKIVATTAIEMSQELKDKLINKLQKVTGKTVILDTKVDKNVLGGIVLKYNDAQLDDSIAMKLKNMKEELSKI